MTAVEWCTRLDAKQLRRPLRCGPPVFALHYASEDGCSTPLAVYVFNPGSRGVPFLMVVDDVRPDVSPAELTEKATKAQLLITTATQPFFGGRRWWLQCNLALPDKQPCNRRVRVLHRPPGARYFGCRHCYRLSYESRQRHRHRGYEAVVFSRRRLDRQIADLGSRSPWRKLRAMLRIDPEWTTAYLREFAEEERRRAASGDCAVGHR